MAESTAQKLARLLQALRGLEADLGTGTLTKAEQSLFAGIADLSVRKGEGEGEGVSIADIMEHCETKNMPVPTIYKCLRDLQTKGLLVRLGSPRSSLYKLA